MQHNTKLLLEAYKEQHLEMVKKLMLEKGSLPPFIQVVTESIKDDSAMNIIHIWVPNESREEKDLFVDKIIPEIKSKVISDDMRIIGVSFSAEAWVRKMKVDSDAKPEDLPKTEMLFVTFSTAEGEESCGYNIIRNFLEVDKEGDLKENIDLEEDVDLKGQGKSEGRFSNLFKTFTQS